MPPAITVLMPVYNAEKYLRQAVDSILNQSFTDFELLVIDDGSNDTSLEIIESYKDRRIRLVKNEQNLGVLATLNKGVEIASCELIARMDADDISHSQRLEKQFEYFSRFPDTVLLSASFNVIDSSGKIVETLEVDHFYNCYNLNFYCAISHPSVMYRRSIIRSAGGYRMPYAEDFDLWWRLMSANYQIGHVNEILVDYRLSESSISNVVKKQENYDTTTRIMLRNVMFYTGPDIDISNAEAEALRHNFVPLEKENSVIKCIRFIKKLDYINKCIYKKSNINYTTAQIECYAKAKREEAVYYFYVRLPKYKALYFLFNTEPFSVIFARFRKIINKSS
jgi:glycosyltransferase involved in cell wall biosynthesis